MIDAGVHAKSWVGFGRISAMFWSFVWNVKANSQEPQSLTDEKKWPTQLVVWAAALTFLTLVAAAFSW
jgi:hypothetical protein